MTTTPTDEPMSVLVSFHYYRSDSVFSRVTRALQAAHDRGATIRLLVDSGAFSADTQGETITVADYAKWLDSMVLPEWGRWLVGALNLDVLRDPDGSWANWADLAARGHDTIPVTHMGDPFDVTDRYVDAGVDYLALGAMVGRSMTRKLRWAAHLHRHVRDHHPGVRLHGLGVSAQQMTERLPWWSVDSSSFGGSYRYGSAKVYDPTQRKVIAISLDGSPDTHRHGRMLRDHYGIDPATIRTSGAHNRTALVKLAAQSCMRWQHDLRRRRPVTPPASRDGDGPWVHFVDGSAEHTVGAINAAGPWVHLVDTDPDLARAIHPDHEWDPYE